MKLKITKVFRCAVNLLIITLLTSCNETTKETKNGVGRKVVAEIATKTDVQRMEDVHQIAHIIERYRQITGRYPFAENWDNVEEDTIAVPISVFISTKKLPEEYKYPPPGITGAVFPYDYFLNYLQKKLGPELTLPEESLDPYNWVPYQFLFDGEDYFVSAHLTKPNEFTRTIDKGTAHKYQVGSVAVPSMKIRAFSEIQQ